MGSENSMTADPQSLTPDVPPRSARSRSAEASSSLADEAATRLGQAGTVLLYPQMRFPPLPCLGNAATRELRSANTLNAALKGRDIECYRNLAARSRNGFTMASFAPLNSRQWPLPVTFLRGATEAYPLIRRTDVTQPNDSIRASAMLMKCVGWGIILLGPVAALTYAPGFFWGELPHGFPLIGPAHPPSPYAGAHPYIFMILALYLAWAILLIQGAKDPVAAKSLFDWGILANLMHGALMSVQAFVYPNEHAHMWADVPLLFAISAMMWRWHPSRTRLGDLTR